MEIKSNMENLSKRSFFETPTEKTDIDQEKVGGIDKTTSGEKLKTAVELAMEKTSYVVEEDDQKRINIEQVQSAKNFEELFLAIGEGKEIQGTQKSYSSEELVALINRVREGESLNLITRSCGLRQKVSDLIQIEDIKEDLGIPPKTPGPLGAKAVFIPKAEEVKAVEDATENLDIPPSKPNPLNAKAIFVPRAEDTQVIKGGIKEELDITPSTPDPLKAKAIYTPKDEETKPINISTGEPKEPSEPPTLETYATFKNKEETPIVESERNQTEKLPQNPLEPLTDEERSFLVYNEKDVDDWQYYKNSGSPLDPEQEKTIEHYNSILEKKKKTDGIYNANSFEKLLKAISPNSTFRDGENVVSSKVLVENIEKFRKGEINADSIPKIFGLPRTLLELAANEVKSKLEVNNKFVELKDYEWSRFLTKYPVNADFLGRRDSFKYPEIGEENLMTEKGQIFGKLEWCDGELAIFRKNNTFITVPFEDILSDSGETYGEIMERNYREDDENRHIELARKSQQARVRHIGE
jgi:hypothetical protein